MPLPPDLLPIWAAEIATLSRRSENPNPVAWGGDLFCINDLTPDMRMLQGDDPSVVTQAIFRRLTTPKGRLLDDLGWGFDLRSVLGGKTTAEIAVLESAILSEVVQDDRIDPSVSVTVLVQDGGDCRVDISGVLMDPSTTPFSLTMALTDSGKLVELLNS